MNAITDLKSGDTNALLFVGEGGPSPTPVPPPTTAAPQTYCDEAFSTGPNSRGDCTCHPRKYCYNNTIRGCQDYWSLQFGGHSVGAFRATCSTCECLAD